MLTSCLFEPLLKRGYKPYLLTHPPYDELFLEDPRVKVIGLKKDELFKSLDLLRGFDLYLDLHKNLKTLALRLLLGGNWKSYPKESLRRRLALRFSVFRKPYSVVEAYLRSIGEKGYRPSLLISEERLKKLRKTYGEDFVVLCPGARYKKKKYPFFKELALELEREGFKVVLVGSEGECEDFEEGKVKNLCGRLSLLDTAGIIKLGKVFVGNDSGLLHVARAVGTKAVQIYGATHPTLGFSLFPEEGVVVLRNLPCQPCTLHGRGDCRYGTYHCLQIPPEEVLREVKALICRVS